MTLMRMFQDECLPKIAPHLCERSGLLSLDIATRSQSVMRLGAERDASDYQ